MVDARLVIAIAEHLMCQHDWIFTQVPEASSSPRGEVLDYETWASQYFLNDFLTNVKFAHGVGVAKENGKRLLTTIDFKYTKISTIEAAEIIHNAMREILAGINAPATSINSAGMLL